MEPKISIVIPTLNEEKDIGKLLLSVSNQSYKNYEIIIVDGGSSDNTVKIAKKYTGKVFVLPKAGVTKSRNYGIKKSTGKIVHIMDADNFLVDTGYLKNVSAIFSTHDIDALAVKISTAPENMLERAQAAYRKTRWEHRQDKIVFDVDPKNITYCCFRKEFIDKIGGYEENLIGNDDLYIAAKTKEAGGKTMFSPDIALYHRDPYNFGQIKRQALWYGRVINQDPLTKPTKLLSYLGSYIAFYLIFISLLATNNLLAVLALNIPLLLASLYIYTFSRDITGSLFLMYVLNPYRSLYFYKGFLRGI